MPSSEFKRYQFPNSASIQDKGGRPYTSLGFVRSKVNFQSLDPTHDENELCRNFYNKAVKELVQYAKEKGGDAVVRVRSVVFYGDGTHKLFPTPECSDDGMEGQILTQGEVIQWKDKSPLASLD